MILFVCELVSNRGRGRGRGKRGRGRVGAWQGCTKGKHDSGDPRDAPEGRNGVWRDRRGD